MPVTKQQQLEYAAKHIEKWKSGYDYAVVEETTDGHLYVRWPSICTSGVTKKEWQQERNKMSSKPEADNSWHERGELPPVGCECEVFVSDENKWMHFEVIAIRDGHALGWCRESSCGFQSNEKSEFRPLSTEREKAIEEMAAILVGCEKYAITQNVATAASEFLYDAGCRMVKP